MSSHNPVKSLLLTQHVLNTVVLYMLYLSLSVLLFLTVHETNKRMYIFSIASIILYICFSTFSVYNMVYDYWNLRFAQNTIIFSSY